AAETPQFWPAAVIAVAGFMAIGAVGRALDAQLLQHLSVPGLIASGAALFFGEEAASRWRFPLGFLFFMTPIGAVAEPLLQTLAANGADVLLALGGVDANLDGLTITTAAGAFFIAPSCAGLRYLLCAAIVATLFSHERLSAWSDRFAFIAAAAVAAVIANAIRIAAIIAAAEHNAAFRARLDDHAFVGWIVFAILMIALAVFGYALADRRLAQARAVAA
ncbi:MAG: exosortase, partial [Pseudomonadota bacterium]